MAANNINMNVFDYFQKEEIRKGLKENLDVNIYAKPEIPYNIMHQLRKGLEKGFDLSQYTDYGVGILCEIRKSMEMGISIIPYIEAGYDSEQLVAIRHALEKGIPIDSYLNIEYHGACIEEIATGLEHHINVTPYADVRYAWRKMREIRLGIEQRLDISKYTNPLYSYWQMREIRLGLKDGLDVDSYRSTMFTAEEMHKRRMLLKSKLTSSSATGKWTVINHKEYNISISPDGLKAYFNWHCIRPIENIEELKDILNQNGIVYGIDYNILDKIADYYKTLHQDTRKDINTLIAQGTPAIHGQSGYYEWFFSTKRSYLPNLLDNGNISFDNLKWYEPVKKGQPLAVYHYAVAGTSGKTVTGVQIPAKNGKEKSILTGKGFDMLPDLKTYIATKDGHVRLCKNELLIEDLIILDELHANDIPIKFDSDVYIKGNITGPVVIQAEGDMVVDGFVEGAQITCYGNLLIKRGINNISDYDTGNIMVHGFVVSHFFEYVTLHAHGNIYFSTSLNSNLSSYGEIISYGKKGGIIGGSSYSEKGYCLPNLGNTIGVNTTLLLGPNENIQGKQFALKNRISTLKCEIQQISKYYHDLNEHPDCNQDKISDLLSKSAEALTIMNHELQTAYEEVSALEDRLARACKSKIIVEQDVYDNVQIRYMDKKITAIPSTQVEILIDTGNIVMQKLNTNITQSA